MGREDEQRETRERVKTTDGVETFKKRQTSTGRGPSSTEGPARQHETALREHEDNDEIQLKTQPLVLKVVEQNKHRTPPSQLTGWTGSGSESTA